MVISFHVQIVPINRKIVPQNSQFIAEKKAVRSAYVIFIARCVNVDV